MGAYEAGVQDCEGQEGAVLCEDGKTCTTGETCHSGVCMDGIKTNCDDRDPCSADSCLEGLGCQHFRVPGCGCGDQHVELALGEQCDEGSANGTPGSCCDAGCKLRPAGETCRSAADLCDVSESCDGLEGACPPDLFASPDNDKPCRPAVDACDIAETCTGSGLACPPDTLQPHETRCDDHDPCSENDVCNDGHCSGMQVCSVDVKVVAVKKPRFEVVCQLKPGEVGQCTALVEVSKPSGERCQGKVGRPRNFNRNGTARIRLRLSGKIRRALRNGDSVAISVCTFVHRIGSSITVIRQKQMRCPKGRLTSTCEITPEVAGE